MKDEEILYSVSCALPQLRYIAYALAAVVTIAALGMVVVKAISLKATREKMRPW